MISGVLLEQFRIYLKSQVVHGIPNDDFNISNHIDFIGTLGPNNYVTSTGTYIADVFKTDPLAPVNMNSNWVNSLINL